MIARISVLTLTLTIQTAFAQSAPAPKPDLAKAKQTAETVCAACHGADGNSLAATFPKLAGQHEAYLYKQLNEFKSVGGKPALRVNALMQAQTAALSDADMRGLAAYFSQQKQKSEVAKNKQTVEFGQKLWRAGDKTQGIPACAGCHGPAGLGIPGMYPRLQGQYADYIETQLKAFRASERSNDPAGVMRGLTLRMTDAEMKAVSDYAAGLR